MIDLAEQRILREQNRDKRQVADSFSRAADTYDAVAALQRQVGHQLLAHAGKDWCGTVLDLGSGTGYFTRILADQPQVERLFALDLAEGMLKFSRQQRPHPKVHWLCADAEQLPLASRSLDGIYSSLAIQWCDDTSALFAEIARVLKPGGVFAFATLGPRTLWELRSAWAEVDDFVHVNRFDSRLRLELALKANFPCYSLLQSDICLRYADLRGLTAELKGIGAHNVNPGRPQGLSGRARISALREAYEHFRGDDALLPATYEVFYGTAHL